MSQATQRRTAGIAVALAATVALTTLAACGGGSEETTTQVAVEPSSSAAPGADLPKGSEHVELDPAEFTTEIDNPYWPMSPGSRWVYRETDTSGAEERVVVEVTGETKRIANGIEAAVVRDTVTDVETGQPVEVTDDWYAQDAEGNIWYLGEATQEYVNGKPGTRQGSFEAGIDGAEPGIAIPADPQPGMEYRQEYLKGEAEDEGAVITVGDEKVQVPYGFFDEGVVMTRDLVPLEPKVQELKFYAPGVGPVLTVHTDGAGGRGELVSYEPGG
jgi:hypothetical protein